MSMPATKLTLQIKDIKGKSTTRSVNALCNDVITSIFVNRIGKIPRLGSQLVVLNQGQVPRARYDGLPDQCNIDLTCLSTLQFDQIVYQFAHELGHFYQYPSDMDRISLWLRRGLPDSLTPWNNWFIESCCCALSYICLDMIGKKWRRRSSVPNNTNYAINFIRYREKDILDALEEQKVPSKDMVAEWIRSELPRLSNRCTTDDKSEHRVCAVEIERILKEHHDAWGCLNYVGDATEDQHTDFCRWSELVASKQQPLVEALSQVFNYKANGP